jgi:acetamidase/formamidase
MAEHELARNRIHFTWNPAHPPAITVEPGDVVHFWTQEVTNGQVTEHSGADALASIDLSRIYPLAGPVAVRGAEPGDALEVEILSLKPDDWGWTGVLPGLGLLSEEFNRPYIKHFNLSDGKTTRFAEGIVLPLQPFCGTMGVAPAEPGDRSVLPPGDFGGNMDIRHLNEGCTLLLPVNVEGGLFSAGDCHAIQGDGEVCVTGIECPMSFSLRFNLRKRRNLPSPQFIVKRSPISVHDRDAGYYATTGVGPDLMEDAKNAVRRMIDWLGSEHHLSPEDAYLLCSLAGDLKISEIVDQPNWIVSFYMPLGIFGS